MHSKLHHRTLGTDGPPNRADPIVQGDYRLRHRTGSSRWWRRRPSWRVHRLSALDRYAFDTGGYLLVEGVLGPGEVDALRAVVAAQGLSEPAESVASQRFGWNGDLLTWDPALRDLVDHPLVVEVLAAFIGPHVRLDHAYGIAMRPGTSGLGVHGPAWPFDPAQYYVHRAGAIRSGLLTFSWSLTDGGPGSGGFGCIRGSHRAAEPLPAGAERLVEEVAQPAGSLLVFTEALVHCTLPWRGSSTRQALLYKYSPGSSAWAAGPAAPPEVVALMTDRQRCLLEPPFVGGRQPALPD